MHPYDNAENLLRVLREPRRNKYFYGKRMDVQHFQLEQDYGKHKQWLLNRLTLGKGVLCGLRVSVSGGRVCVDPGVAIDGLGREIIVPMRYCIDPVVVDGGCCDAHPHAPANADPNPRPSTHAHGGAAAAENGMADGLFTLWLCYRECLTDHQPVLVSECGTRDECAAGTIVESFCLKFLDGPAPPLGDPDWCADLWHTGHSAGTPAPADGDPRNEEEVAVHDGLHASGGKEPASRRQLLCELFDGDCGPPEGDPCVPLALVQVRDGRLTIDSCLVRPRIYRNQRRLDLILCLAEKVDECCNDHPPAQPLQVRAIDFIRRGDTAGESLVASVSTPLQTTVVNINGRTNAIRIRFNKALATDQHKPSTHALNDPDFKLHNIQVLPDGPLNNLPYVPGSATLEAPDTVRFDLFPDSPYSRGADGWQKGNYRIMLRGTEDLAQNRQALADPAGNTLDGEPIAPAAGVMSGNGTAGGDFVAAFTVGASAPSPSPSPSPPPAPAPVPPPPAPPPPNLMHVRKIEFLGLVRNGQEREIGELRTPEETVALTDHLAAIRIGFDMPFAPTGPGSPTTAGINDPAFQTHNVQLRLSREATELTGLQFLAGKLVVEDSRTLRINVARGTRLVNRTGGWLANQTIGCEIFLRGTAGAASNLPALADAAGNGLDGEPRPPSGGVMSGDGAAGGDFIASFTVFING